MRVFLLALTLILRDYTVFVAVDSKDAALEKTNYALDGRSGMIYEENTESNFTLRDYGYFQISRNGWGN